ncbi:putative TIM-barrel fold metal-dependent hydrolase [Aeromicrobium panaciterrae]|uniref:TIM-barrel fold metal-dependent hydrolase n=1 Tax=Aeromicrobium panaciterrae TaxID=363861 RepID=A0ABU1UQX6_9ACTN|nr:amidohydrolase family protein [Aeromicrobium panaciterrae]MDR7087591.1 putative TIM-barrel fold metal-dependent hydrolase [Aeromicrobium panaciterrae]
MQDDQLPELAAGLGIPGLFDVHAHFMPPAILAKVWAYFDSAGPLLGRTWPITYRGTDEERVEQLRAMGVKKFSSMSYAHKPGIAGYMNDWTRGFAERTPDTLWSATFYPEPEAASYVTQLIDDGVELFKAHLQVGDFAANDPLLEPVWGAIADSSTPLVLHAGSGPAPGTHTGPAGIADVLSRHPSLKVIIAHMGMPEYSEFLDLADRYDNVHLDTTMAFVDFWDGPSPAEIAPRLVDLQDRILFGTDFPNIPYAYAHQVEALQRLDLGDEWMADVLWNNGVKLFGAP